MTLKLRRALLLFAISVSLGCCFLSSAMAQTVIYSEDFESLDLGPNVDEGLNNDMPEDAVWSPDGPPGWTVDRSGVPGYGTAADGVIEFAGWNFVDPIWWSFTAGNQERDFFIDETEMVIAVADGDEWDDAFHEPGTMNTFLSTPPIPVAPNDPLEFLTSWRPDGTQVATITASYDGGAETEVLRWESNLESDFYQEDLNPEIITVPLDAPDGAQNVVFKFGYTEAGNNWWWAIDNIEHGDYFEDFENVELGPNIEEGRAVPADNVWTKEPPAGWTIRDEVPGQDEENDLNGVTEWIGWSFTDKDWWVAVAGDQRRSEFSNGEGTVAVADPDEWDDAAHPDSASEGWYNTFMETGEISLEGVEAGSVQLKFDSSWRPEFDDNYQQTGNLTVRFDDGPETELFLWESDPLSDDYKDDNSTNETIVLDINNPEGASTMTVTFGLFDAGNDWWWAIDNIEVIANRGNVDPCDFNGDGVLGVEDIDLLLAEVKSGANNAAYDITGDSLVDQADIKLLVEGADKLNTYIGDANLDGQFNSSDLVAVFTAGEYEDGVAMNSTWAEGDWTGDAEFGSSDLVAAFTSGGFEMGPKAAPAAVPEPSSLIAMLTAMTVLGLRRRSKREDA